MGIRARLRAAGTRRRGEPAQADASPAAPASALLMASELAAMEAVRAAAAASERCGERFRLNANAPSWICTEPKFHEGPHCDRASGFVLWELREIQDFVNDTVELYWYYKIPGDDAWRYVDVSVGT